MNWSVRRNGSLETLRNLTLDEVRQMILDGELQPDDWAREGPQQPWTEVGALTQFNDALPAIAIRSSMRHWDPEDAEMDMTPMIDVTFLLLIFFMVTAVFSVTRAMEMPGATTSSIAPEVPTLGEVSQDAVVVAIRRDDAIQILHFDADGKLARTQEVPAGNLHDELVHLARTARKTRLLIHPDPDAHHEALVRVLDAAQRAEFEEISIGRDPVSVDPAPRPAANPSP